MTNICLVSDFFRSHLWLSLLWRRKYAAHILRKLTTKLNVCELWPYRRLNLKWNCNQIFEMWTEFENLPSYISRCLPKPEFRSLFYLRSRQELELLLCQITGNRVCTFFECLFGLLHPCTLDLQAALTQKMCPHSLEVTHGTSGMSKKSAFNLLSTKQLQKVSFDGSQSSDLSSLIFRFFFTVYSGPFRGGSGDSG